MKLIIQRVKNARVTLKETNEITGEIRNGLFVLVGFKRGDTKEIVDSLVTKLHKLRVMSDQNGKMNLRVSEVGGKYLIVSQFTLYANTKEGNRPSFINAEDPLKAGELYEYLIGQMRKNDSNVETGKFGEYMNIEASLDGPVTIVIES